MTQKFLYFFPLAFWLLAAKTLGKQGDITTTTIYTISRHSRIRLAKSFFSPFLGAEWLHYRRRAPTGGQLSPSVLAANSQNASGKKYTNFGSFSSKLLKF